MGRPHRDFFEGVYHVAPHSSDDRVLFVTDGDRQHFLDRLARTCATFALELVSYTLMTTHYHMLVWTPDDRLSRALQGLHGGYSLLFNLLRGRRAHLFRNHCPARRIRDDDDLLNAARYLARNPVEAGMVASPLDWPWSSARAHAGLGRPQIPLHEQRLADAFGGKPADRPARYAVFVS